MGAQRMESPHDPLSPSPKRPPLTDSQKPPVRFRRRAVATRVATRIPTTWWQEAGWRLASLAKRALFPGLSGMARNRTEWVATHYKTAALPLS
jgi:hypothetical protein